ncbi:exopolysaccharide transport family protein [Caballeronia calidae]|uniref:Putative tyrosine-protein kinase EpsB n=2 Tax=Caballeronia calidae TaxID=1777139 RepID=A0A158C049_9BURK|nr:polysaccharide biosynthesis tyrosine autokinase [Caballeronia calidae]SAK75266.1 exopolysaccharide transport family protein [Caballeronia calidae]
MDNSNIVKRPDMRDVQDGSNRPAKEQDDDIDLVTFLDTVMASKKLIVCVVATFFVSACIYAFLATPVYQASILVQVEDNVDSSAKSLLGDVSSLFNVKSTSVGEIQILQSRMIIGQAADNLALYVEAKPQYFPIIGGWIARHSDALPAWNVLPGGGYAWGKERISVAVFDVPKYFEGDKFTVVALQNGSYRLEGSDLTSPIEAEVGKLSTIAMPRGDVRILVDKIDGSAGTRFSLKRYARLKTISDLQDAVKVVEQGKDSNVISATWEDTDAERVSLTMNEIARLYLKQNVERKAAEAQKSLDFLNGQIPTFRKQLETAERRYNEMRTRSGSIDLDAEGRIMLQQSTDIETKMLDLTQRRIALLANLSERHPEVLALNEQIGALNEQSAKLKHKVALLPDREQEIVRLTRDVQVDTNLYTALLSNVQQLELLKAGKVGNVRLLDSAVVPDDPVKPKKAIVILASIFAGLFVAVALAFLRRVLYDGVSDAHEIETHAGLPVYAVVPFMDGEDQSKPSRGGTKLLQAVANPEEPAIESLRSFRTALQFAMLESNNNLVLLTGSAPGVGKSFISANLAAVLASGGKRVLLIDCDLRAGRLHQYFGGSRAPGFSDLIAGRLEAQQVIRKEVAGDFDFVSTGTFPPNPAELLLSERLKTVLGTFSKQYDIVLIDSAPILAVADTINVASVVGTTFLVARAGKTRVGELVECRKRLAQNGVQVRGSILNGMRSRTGRYGYGDKYGMYRYTTYKYGPRNGD